MQTVSILTIVRYNFIKKIPAYDGYIRKSELWQLKAMFISIDKENEIDCSQWKPQYKMYVERISLRLQSVIHLEGQQTLRWREPLNIVHPDCQKFVLLYFETMPDIYFDQSQQSCRSSFLIN